MRRHAAPPPLPPVLSLSLTHRVPTTFPPPKKPRGKEDHERGEKEGGGPAAAAAILVGTYTNIYYSTTTPRPDRRTHTCVVAYDISRSIDRALVRSIASPSLSLMGGFPWSQDRRFSIINNQLNRRARLLFCFFLLRPCPTKVVVAVVVARHLSSLSFPFTLWRRRQSSRLPRPPPVVLVPGIQPSQNGHREEGRGKRERRRRENAKASPRPLLPPSSFPPLFSLAPPQSTD